MVFIALLSYMIAGFVRRYLKQQRAKAHMLRRASSMRGEEAETTAASGGKGAKARARARVEKRRAKKRGKKEATALRFEMSSVTIRLMMLLIFSIRFLYPGVGRCVLVSSHACPPFFSHVPSLPPSCSTILKSFVCVNSPNGRVLKEMVSLKCWTPAFWSRIGSLGLAASFVLLVGLPVALAWAVIAERRTWLRQMAEEDAEKSVAINRLFKSHQSVTDRLKEKAHSTIVQHHHKTVELRHKVIHRFIRRNKPEYW